MLAGSRRTPRESRASVVVPSPEHGVPECPEQQEDQADNHGQNPKRPNDRDLGQESNDQ
jgi:hypothetical protein